MSHHCHKDASAESHCKQPSGHDEKRHDEHHHKLSASQPSNQRHCHHKDYHDDGETVNYDLDDFKVKLYYFDTRGRAELIRLILSFAGQPFEDIRYTAEQWQSVKNNFPARQVPVLTIEHCGGQKITITQSLTIARHLATCFGLSGNNNLQRAQCDEVVDCLNDLINLAVHAFLEQDSNRREMIKRKLREEEYPRIIGYLEQKLVENGGKHIVSNKWTYADLAIAWFIGGLEYRGAAMELIQQRFPNVCHLRRDVEAIPEIKDWITKRPATEM